MARSVEVKKSCCQDRPRCKRCPVVWQRLARVGLAKGRGHRVYQPAPDLKKRHIEAARRS